MFEQMESEPVTTLHKNSRVLIVDSLNTFLRNFVAIHHLNPSGAHIGGLGGFLKSIGAAIRDMEPTRVILVFDGHGGSTNKRYLYPEYKANRHITKISNWDIFDNQQEESEAITNQIIRLVDYLKCLPVDLVAIDKIEADDVIGYLATKLPEKVTILSTDQDYLQLVSDNISVYSPVKKVVYDPNQVLKDYGIPPHNFLTHKIVVGDKGDNVPGVKGIAMKTLIKMFPILATNEIVKVEDVIEQCREKNGKFADVYNYRHQLSINKKLMDLQNPNIPEEDAEKLNRLINNARNQFHPVVFLELYKEDQLGKTILNPNIWVNEIFSKLSEYKIK